MARTTAIVFVLVAVIVSLIASSAAKVDLRATSGEFVRKVPGTHRVLSSAPHAMHQSTCYTPHWPLRLSLVPIDGHLRHSATIT